MTSEAGRVGVVVAVSVDAGERAARCGPGVVADAEAEAEAGRTAGCGRLEVGGA